ncbi:MAG: hypothetical protein ACM3ZC_11950 [Bacteroidota bacterium]
MFKRAAMFLFAAVVCAALIAGCGSGGTVNEYGSVRFNIKLSDTQPPSLTQRAYRDQYTRGGREVPQGTARIDIYLDNGVNRASGSIVIPDPYNFTTPVTGTITGIPAGSSYKAVALAVNEAGETWVAGQTPGITITAGSNTDIGIELKRLEFSLTSFPYVSVDGGTPLSMSGNLTLFIDVSQSWLSYFKARFENEDDLNDYFELVDNTLYSNIIAGTPYSLTFTGNASSPVLSSVYDCLWIEGRFYFLDGDASPVYYDCFYVPDWNLSIPIATVNVYGDNVGGANFTITGTGRL